MKILSVVSIVFLILGCVIVGAKEFNDNLSLLGKIIVIDAGHGGKDPGTNYKDIYEKDINLNIAIFLEKELAKKGASVVMTRTGDYDLSSPNARYRKKSDFDNRINIINDSKADLYISLHINYLNDSRYKGIQVFYLNNDKDAMKLQDSLNKDLSSNREAKKMSQSYYMYDKLNVSGFLIECGFLSNASERNKLITEGYQKAIAQAIANGIKKIF